MSLKYGPVELAHLLTDLRLLVGRVKVGHLAGVQQVVDVLQKRFLLYLCSSHITVLFNQEINDEQRVKKKM